MMIVQANVSAPGRITTGRVGTHLILPLLSRHNRSDLALQLAMGTELPSWGYMIEHGAITLWESWSGAPDMSLHQPPSHNHHFLGGCVQWFHFYIYLLGFCFFRVTFLSAFSFLNQIIMLLSKKCITV